MNNEVEYDVQIDPKVKEFARKAAPYVAVGLVCFLLGRHSVKIPEIPVPAFPEKLLRLPNDVFQVLMSNGQVWTAIAALPAPVK
jgi:hypothetical protein